jgi:hypothetical protein
LTRPSTTPVDDVGSRQESRHASRVRKTHARSVDHQRLHRSCGTRIR